LSVKDRVDAPSLLEKTLDGAEHTTYAGNRRDDDDETEIHPRNLFESGKLEAASTTRKPATIGSRRALTICAQTVSQMRFGASQDECRSPQHACCVDTIERWCAERLSFGRTTVAGGLTKRPGKRQGAYDRCDDGRPSRG